MKYINEEKFWKHSYRVHLHEFDTEGLLVNADCEQDALDYAVDHAERMGWEGCFCSEEELEEMTEAERDDTITVGNHGKTLSSHSVAIEQLD